jgi:Uncharacterized membrane protein, putative virulence factor
MNKYLRNFFDKIKNSTLIRDTITTSILSIIGKGVGFLIPFFVARWFGISNYTDAFFFAYGVILFLSITIAPAVESTVVPFINQLLHSKGDVGKFISTVFLFITPILMCLVWGVILLARPTLSIVTKFDSESLDLAIRLIIELSPLIALLVISSILAGSMNAYKRFATPALSPAFRAIVNLLIIYFLKNEWGVYSIARGYVIGELLRIAVLLYMIRKYRLFNWNFSFKLSNDIKEFFLTSAYQMMGMIAVGLNPIIDQTMASWLGSTKISILSYANRLYVIPITFLSSGFIVTLLSHWSDRVQKSGILRLASDVKKTLKVCAYISLAIAILSVLLSKYIVFLCYGKQTFSSSVSNEVVLCFIFYMVGLVPYILARVLTRALLTLKEVRILMAVGMLKNFLNIVLNIILMRYLGVIGIVMSTSFTSIFEYVFYYRYFKRLVYKNSVSLG